MTKIFKIGLLIGILLLVGGCAANEKENETTERIAETEEVELVFETERVYEDSMIDKIIGMKPTVVCLQTEVNGVTTTGSGFIMEISEEDVYICTNRHMINEYDEWNVYFFDGTSAVGEKLGVAELYDVGIVKVERANIEKETLNNLFSVKIDLSYWESIGSEEIELGMLRIGTKGEIIHTKLGILLRKQIEFLWGNGEMETELSIDQEEGDSGSALFDKEGRLISMVFGTSQDVGGERNWGVPLDAIITSYQQITDRILIE